MARASFVLLGIVLGGGPPAVPRAVAPTGERTSLAAREGRVLVPAGAFLMGSSEQDLAEAALLCVRDGVPEAACAEEQLQDELPVHEVRLPAFRIDRTEVTNADYARCVRSGECRSPMQFPGDRRFDGERYPVVGVSWSDAAAFCRWTAGRLPTEAEWERAARGLSARIFPWGRTWNPHLANHGRFGIAPGDGGDGFRHTAPVGSYPDGASALGILDLAGNVWEWTTDWYEEYEPDPAAPSGHVYRAIRGGSWTSPAHHLRVTTREAAPPEYRSLEIGLRCAQDD